jgi:hypothetical protein
MVHLPEAERKREREREREKEREREREREREKEKSQNEEELGGVANKGSDDDDDDGSKCGNVEHCIIENGGSRVEYGKTLFFSFRHKEKGGEQQLKVLTFYPLQLVSELAGRNLARFCLGQNLGLSLAFSSHGTS